MALNLSETAQDPAYTPDHISHQMIASLGLESGNFNIEEFWQTIDFLEQNTGNQYIRMDFGVPGLAPADVCVNEHVAAIQSGDVVQNYPPYSGHKALRTSVATFVNRRTGLKLSGDNFIITCGGTQALFIAQSVAGSLSATKNKIVFLAPVYPPMIQQARFLGLETVAINTIGLPLSNIVTLLAREFEQGDVAAVYWASPSNPAWQVMDDATLHDIAELCEIHGVIPIEDMTYLGMAGKDGELHPRTPSIGSQTPRYFSVFSSSKMFSYAGERVGFLAAPAALLDEHANALMARFNTTSVRKACESMVFNITAGAPYSAQNAIAGLLNAINDGEFDLTSSLSVYARRAALLKAILIEQGFELMSPPNANGGDDGFYVCFSYQNLPGTVLVQELLKLGVAVLPLSAFHHNLTVGVRACVGRVTESQLRTLRETLKQVMDRRES